MKTVTLTRVLLLAAVVWLPALPALAAGPTSGPRYRNPRVAAHPDAQSRVRSRTTAQAAPRAAAPEAITTPVPSEQTFAYEGGGAMWDETAGYFDDGGGCVDESCGTCRKGLWYFSADYLLVRPRLSQGVAAVEDSLETNESGSTVTETFSQKSTSYCFKYNSSFRLALGYRLLECGGDIQFSYWRLTGDDRISVGPATTINQSTSIRGQLGNNPANGQFLSAWTGITANIYDIDYGKRVSYGGPQGAFCGDCCGYCPRWDVRYTAGVRIGDVSRFNNNAVTESNGDVTGYGNVDARFTGAGPRLGLQGRRYFGPCGKFSLFAKGSQALLIGDYEMSRVLTQFSGQTSQQVDITAQYDPFCRIIPVTDLELGATWQVAPYAFASIGWFWQAWWDLGQSETIQGTSFGGLDTANILGFDGLFVRGELLF